MEMSFQSVDVKDEIHKLLKKELPKFGFDRVKVVKADPHTHTEIPCVAINRLDDSEGTDTIGDHVDTHYDPATQKHYQVYGSYFNEAIEVRVWHENADERDKLYQHVKAILYSARHHLTELGLINTKLRSGKDEQDSSMAQAPMVFYWAPITMSYMNPLNVTFTEIVQPITAIIDKTQPSEDNDGEVNP